MNNTIYERGEVLDVLIPEDWQPKKQPAKRCRILQKQKISRVVILDNKGDDVYLAVPCDIVRKGDSVPIWVDGHNYYARIYYVYVDAAVLSRSEHTNLQDKENVLRKIECKFEEKAERKRQAKERRRERKKNDSVPLQAVDSVPQRHQSIKDYEIVPIARLNHKAFKHRIILTNYFYDECLVCNNRLIDFVNFIEIGKDKGIRVPGKWCIKCDAFFEERGFALKHLSEEIAFSKDYNLQTEFLFPEYLSLTSSSVAIGILMKHKKTNEHRLVTIVTSDSVKNHEQHVFHYGDVFARQLLYEVSRQNKTMIIDGEEFELLKILHPDQKDKSLLNRFIIDKIVLRSGGGLYGGLL